MAPKYMPLQVQCVIYSLYILSLNHSCYCTAEAYSFLIVYCVIVMLVLHLFVSNVLQRNFLITLFNIASYSIIVEFCHNIIGLISGLLPRGV